MKHRKKYKLKHHRIKVFDIILFIIMCGIVCITVFPFWNQLMISLSGGYGSYEGGLMLFPVNFTTEAYKVVLGYSKIWQAFGNSILRMVLGTVLSLIGTFMMAYPLSKKDLPFRKSITVFIVFTMLFNGGLIPNFLVVKKLGMLNTIWALVVPGMITAWNVLVMRNFLMALPESLEEAAHIDGASTLQIIFKVVIPLSVPVLATIGLWTAVANWNSWFDATLYIQNSELITLPVLLRQILIENNSQDIAIMAQKLMSTGMTITDRQLQSTVIIVSILPMLLIYPFIQKYFAKGIMLGSVKG